MKRRAAYLALTAALALGIAGVANAAKPAGSSISLVVLGTQTAAATTQPTFGSQVTFNVSTDKTSEPWVDLKCSKGGVLVYEQWNGFYGSYQFGQTFTLGPTQMWTSGAANCTAYLDYFTSNGSARTLASTSFSVAG